MFSRASRPNREAMTPAVITRKVIKMPRKSRQKSLHDYPSHLRGYSNNRFGGHKNVNLKAYGRDWNRSYPCHTYSDEEKRTLEKQRGVELWPPSGSAEDPPE